MDSDIKKFEPFWDTWYIKDIIGEGSFGKVYSIERIDFGTTYVSAMKHIKVPQSQAEVKSIVADGMDDNSVGKYFEKLVEDIIEEFVLMSKLKGNSNIVSYEDHKVVKNPNKIEWDIFIRMEKLTPLIDYISKNKVAKKDIIKLGIDICKALELCQKYNIIHRDIKPENIFVSENGDFKLGDFGIARQVEKTTAGLSKKGTYTYIAPEVYKGEAYGLTVDIYSLGIVMYRLLNNNRTPFMPEYPKLISHGDKETALVKRMSGQKLPKPVNAEDRLAKVILKACEFYPENRYRTPTAMRIELENILNNVSEETFSYSPKQYANSYVDLNDDLSPTQFMPRREVNSEQSFDNTIYEYNKPQNNKKNYITIVLCSVIVFLVVFSSIIIYEIYRKKDISASKEMIEVVTEVSVIETEKIKDVQETTQQPISTTETEKTTEKTTEKITEKTTERVDNSKAILKQNITEMKETFLNSADEIDKYYEAYFQKATTQSE